MERGGGWRGDTGRVIDGGGMNRFTYKERSVGGRDRLRRERRGMSESVCTNQKTVTHGKLHFSTHHGNHK